jgi:hypothetical protein
MVGGEFYSEVKKHVVILVNIKFGSKKKKHISRNAAFSTLPCKG